MLVDFKEKHTTLILAHKIKLIYRPDICTLKQLNHNVCMYDNLSVFFSGISSMTVPVYIAEVSPSHLRGQLVTINTLFITGGQFIASVIDGAFSYLSHDGWRYALVLNILIK